VYCVNHSLCFCQIMEFSSVIWNPYFKMDMNKIGDVQSRFTKVIFPKLTYPEKLLRSGLQTWRCDELLQVYEQFN